MLSRLFAVRLANPKLLQVDSFRPVWAMCAAIAGLVHVVGWMIEAGAQHKAPAQEVQEGEGDSLLRTPERADDE